MTPIADIGISTPPKGITPELWAEAYNIRYWAAYHCSPLSGGNTVIFDPSWTIVYIGPHEGALAYFRSAQKPDRRRELTTPLVQSNELFKLLNLE
jgi:hypothetical protein